MHVTSRKISNRSAQGQISVPDSHNRPTDSGDMTDNLPVAHGAASVEVPDFVDGETDVPREHVRGEVIDISSSDDRLRYRDVTDAVRALPPSGGRLSQHLGCSYLSSPVRDKWHSAVRHRCYCFVPGGRAVGRKPSREASWGRAVSLSSGSAFIAVFILISVAPEPCKR